MNESRALARYICETGYDDLPAHVVSATKRSILDALGVTLAAGTLGEGCKQFVDLAIAQGGRPESTIIGFGAKVPAAMAAFANGAMAHALDFEDAHDGALMHPNAATIPAALAVAERIGQVSGKDFIAAVAIGSDIVCRLGLALNVNLLDYGWYAPPIFNVFGATAAACKLLNLSERQILDAFSLALCQVTCSAELIYSTHSLIRSIRDAFSAKAGVLAALLAKDGVTGFDQPIEGKAGLYNLYSRGNYSPERLTEHLGEVFEGAAVSFKPWPSCRGTHPYVQAALEIQRESGVTAEKVSQVRVVVNSVNKMLCEPRENKNHPTTAIDAKFSIPFVVATALVRGQVTLDDFSPWALRDQRVLDLAKKVTYQVDPRLSLQGTVQGSAEIDTPDGSTFSKHVDVPYGHPRNPIADEHLEAKFLDCARHSFKKYSTQELASVVVMIRGLENLSDVGELGSCLT